jgi:acyl-CoA thioesterase I
MIKIILMLSLYLATNISNAMAKTILFLGDSLTAGYGVEKEHSYPSLIEKKIQDLKLTHKVINGGISGSTTASAISRLNWFEKLKPDVLFLALGANDGLRGLELTQTQKNLQQAIEWAKKNNMQVVLGGMELPPNYGEKYRQQFRTMYKELSQTNSVKLIPFMLEGVGGIKEHNIEDGIHPNQKGHQIVSETVWKVLKDYL